MAMQKLTPSEIALLESSIQCLCPGFRLFDRNEFILTGYANALKQLAGKKEFLDTDGKTVLWPLVVKHVCTDVKRDGYGVPFAWWWIFLQSSLIPDVSPEPWNEVRWWLFEELRGTGDTLTMWGSQSSGKSYWMACFTVVMMVAWGKDAIFYVAGPKLKHSDDKVWQAIIETADSMMKNASECVATLKLSSLATKTDLKITGPNGVGAAKFVSAEESSAVRGKKSRDKSGDPMKGITALLVDEYAENIGLDLMRINNNGASNANFFQILAANPDPDLVMHPSIKAFGEPSRVTNLDRTLHFRWQTARGLCVRFCWANSPNRVLGRDQWPTLLCQWHVDRVSKKGQSAIDAEVDAWGISGGGKSSILDAQKIKLAGTYDSPIWTGPTRRCMSVDPAFGGQDVATAWIFEVGNSMFKARNGDSIERTVMSSIEHVILPVTSSFIVTEEWLEECEEIFAWTGGGWPGGSERAPLVGMELFGNCHCAYLAGKAMKEYEIRPGDWTFDASQRADCADWMKSFCGAKDLRWFYEGSRTLKQEEALAPGWYQRPLQYQRHSESSEKTPKLWSETCTTTISMLWMSCCELIKAGYLVNGDTCQKGLDELCARPISKRRGADEGRKDVVSKAELKSMGMPSPSYAETMCMGMYLAVRWLGLIKLEEPTQSIVTVQQAEPFMFVSAGKRGFNRFK